MKIGILGDLHGNSTWAVYALQRLSQAGVTEAVQLGDFGFGLAESRFLRSVEAACKTYRINLIVVPGNHEDYDLVNGYPLMDDGFQSVSDHIVVAPRGHRWKMGGRSFVALGGAPSVDRTYRQRLEREKPGRRFWWKEEQITKADVDKVIEGGHADIMVAHDAPYVQDIQRRIEGNPHGWEQRDIEYADKGRKLMDRAFSAVQPHVFLHGHYHFPVYDNVIWSDHTVSHVVGLDADNSDNSFGLLETDDFTVTVAPLQREGFLVQQGWSEKEAKLLVDRR